MESTLIPYQAETYVAHGKALVFAPHPDDEVLGCGGAIMRHLAAGDSVQVIVMTDGAAALTANDTIERTDYVKQRQRESLAAAQILGYGEPEFWGLPDRGLQQDESLIRRIVERIKTARAAVVYAPSPLEIHPDHRTLAMLAIAAVCRIKDPSIKLAMYEVGIPLRPNILLDISDLMQRKQTAIACFTSQLKIQPYDQHSAALNRFRTYTLPRTVVAAEAYCVANLSELQNSLMKLLYDTTVQQYEDQRRNLYWEEQYRLLIASRSWRFTAPMRSLVDRARALFKICRRFSMTLKQKAN